MLKEGRRIARQDSVDIEIARGRTIQGLEWDIVQLEKLVPHWWEKPATVMFATMMVTIWAVLKAVSISI